MVSMASVVINSAMKVIVLISLVPAASSALVKSLSAISIKSATHSLCSRLCSNDCQKTINYLNDLIRILFQHSTDVIHKFYHINTYFIIQ